jgi:hypothetical protein
MACTVFFGASAQSTLLLFFSVTLFAILAHSQCCFFKTTVSIHPQEQKVAVHSNRHHHARLCQKKKQPEAKLHNMTL